MIKFDEKVDEDEKEINAGAAAKVVKNFLEEMRGAKIKLFNRPLFDWMNFKVTSVDEENGLFIVKCELLEDLFSSKKEKYTIKVNKKGEIKRVRKE